jgi:hypothetical protein
MSLRFPFSRFRGRLPFGRPCPAASARTRRRAASFDGLAVQQLEPRVLLAGDVTVFVDSNLVLNVIGDEFDNQVLISGGVLSSAQVSGLEGTTINGGASGFSSGIGLRGLRVVLQEGNDRVDLHGGRFSFAPRLEGNAGRDLIRVRNSSLRGVTILGGSDSDVIEIDQLFAAGSTLILGGDGHDMLAIYGHAATGRIVVEGGIGNDTLAVDRMGMFDSLQLDMQAGDDQVLIAGETWIGESSQMRLGSGEDFLAFVPAQRDAGTRLRAGTVIDTGQDNDRVLVGEGVTGDGDVLFLGSTGTDGFSNPDGTLAASSIQRFEDFDFDAGPAIEEVFRRIADAGIDPVLFGGVDSSTLQIDLNTIPLSYTEDGPPVSLDALLQVSGPSATIVTSASVLIVGYVSGQDVLDFSDVGTVTGVFDDATGILRFEGDGTLTQYQTALRSVTYRNTSQSPLETARSLDVRLISNEADANASRTLNVFAVNDIPQLEVRDTELKFDIDDPDLVRPAILDDRLTLTDADTPTFSEATVRIVSGGQAGDYLGFVDAGGISGVYDGATGTLTLSGSAVTGAWQNALRNVTFDSTVERTPAGVRTIRFEISDGQTLVADQFDLQVVASQTISVETTPGDLSYQETDDPVLVDPDVTIGTGGDPQAEVDGATVSIVAGLDSSQDRLTFDPVSSITGSYDAASGVLTLTGTAAAADYQTVLQSVRFFNSSFGDFDFSTDERVVEFAVERGGLTARDSRTIVITEIASEQDLIERYLDVNNLTSQVTPSGLHYIVLQEGNGDFPDSTSTVTVNYRGTLLNGDEFDANDNISFSLQSVIAGWTEGIPKFSVGGSGILLIPSDLAYGASPRPGIPPNSILRFDVDLLSFV